MNGSSNATFHPPWKACKDAISSTKTNSMTCWLLFWCSKANQDSREKLFYSVKHLWCIREYSKHWEYQGNKQTWSKPSNTEMTEPIRSLDLAFLLIPKAQRNIKVSSLSKFVCTRVCKARVFLYGAAPYFWDRMRFLIELTNWQYCQASLVSKSGRSFCGILGTLQALPFTWVLRIWPRYNSLKHLPSP